MTIKSSIDSSKPAEVLTHPKYRPDIDGLRAVAVLSVVFFHAFPLKIPGGFIGVDIFFVISGFLISSIIFSNLEREHFSFVEFYSRRVKRIFPALLLVLISSFIFAWYVLLVDEYQQFSKHIVAGAGFVSNFALWYESGYFDSSADMKPLLHLWSLAIEEQFYIFWPLLLAFVWKRKWSFVAITLTIATLSFSYNIYAANTNPTADFYSPLSRFWELMVGGLLAYIVLHKPHWNHKYQNAQSILGFTLLLSALIFINRDREFPGWWALLPTMGSFLLISAGSHSIINHRILSSKLFVWFGLISYPLYLWHWPLLSFARIIEGANIAREIRLGAIAIAIVLAWLTYRFIERPFRFGQNSKTKTISLLAVMSSLFVFGIVSNQYLQPRNGNISAETQSFVSAINDWEYPGQLKKYQMLAYQFYIDSKKTDTTLIIGDSHVEQYSSRVVNVVTNNQEKANTAVFVTNAACLPIPDVLHTRVNKACGATIQNGLKESENENVKAIVLGACWSCYFLDSSNTRTGSEDSDHYVLENGKKEFFRTGRGKELALLKLEELLKTLGKNKKVYLLLDNPTGDNFGPRSFFTGSRLRSIEIKAGSKTTKLDEQQSKLHDDLINVARRAGVEIIDPMSKLCNGQECYRLTDNGEPIYKDEDHLRASYVRENADYLDKALFLQ